MTSGVCTVPAGSDTLVTAGNRCIDAGGRDSGDDGGWNSLCRGETNAPRQTGEDVGGEIDPGGAC